MLKCCSIRTDRQTDMMKYQTLSAILQTRLKTAMDHTRRYGKNFGAISNRGVYMAALHGDCAAHGQLRERESSVPGYDAVSLGKYLPTLVRKFEDYLPSQTASHFSNAVRTPHLSSQRIIYCYNLANYRYAPHNDISVNDGPHGGPIRL